MAKKVTTFADDESVLSKLSSVSASVLAKFPWLRGGAENMLNNIEYDEDSEEKQMGIRYCLNGVEEEVNLWQLRDIALSRGGLVNSSIRKRAWPKLVGAHELILQSSQKLHHQTLVNVSSSSMQLLVKDVAQSVWAIEDHVNMARQREEIKLSKLRTRKVSFVPDLTESKSGESDFISPVKSVGNMHTNMADDCDDCDDGTLDGSVGTFSPNTLGSLETCDTSLIKTMPKRNASKSEQKVLFNIVISVLRMVPDDSPHFEDDRYRYYHGLADVAALMLINLESPSLTSLVLGQLAERHFRDAMRSTTSSVESAVRLSFYPLLEKADSVLYSHISSCMEIPSFCVPWIQCWFCQQLTDVRIASRLVDVFLASHASMPIYFCVAFLCHPRNRSKIMATKTNLKNMHSALRLLPLQMMNDSLESDEIVEIVEDIIEMALSYVSRFPPDELLRAASSDVSLASVMAMAPTVSMLQPLPAWATVPSAPTDYAVLQQAKALRLSGETCLAVKKQKTLPSSKLYPRALAAAGAKREGSKRSLLAIIVVMLLLVAGGVFVTLRVPGAAKVPPVVQGGKPVKRKTMEQNSSMMKEPTPMKREQPKPIVAAVQREEQPKPIVAAVQREEQPKPIVAAVQREEQPKPIVAAVPREEQPKPIVAAVQCEEQPKPIVAAVQHEEQPKPIVAAVPREEQSKPIVAAVQHEEQPKPIVAAVQREEQPKPIVAAVQREEQKPATPGRATELVPDPKQMHQQVHQQVQQQMQQPVQHHGMKTMLDKPVATTQESPFLSIMTNSNPVVPAMTNNNPFTPATTNTKPVTPAMMTSKPTTADKPMAETPFLFTVIPPPPLPNKEHIIAKPKELSFLAKLRRGILKPFRNIFTRFRRTERTVL